MSIALKVSTAYTFGAVYGTIKDTVAALKEQGVTAAGIVDTDTWGHVSWFKECKNAGITPLLGVSWVVSCQDDRIPRMWFLAASAAGLSELYTALSNSYSTPVPTKRGPVPSLLPETILGFSDNVLVFAGDICDMNYLSSLYAARPNSTFIDIAENGSHIANMLKRNIAASIGAPLVATRDNAYLTAANKDILEYLPYGRSSVKDLSLAAPVPIGAEAQVVEYCKGLELPHAPMIHLAGSVEEECRAGIERRFPNGGWDEAHEARLVHELEEIAAKDFNSYFLVVADMVRWAKKHMLVGPSRGSAAGSLVCYLMGITEIDPVPVGLYFERFIDKTRTDLPDIDLDFPDEQRGKVIEYLAARWGSKHVAHVGSIAVFKPKSALVQVTKKLGIPAYATSEVKNAIIERQVTDARALLCLADTLDNTDAGRAFIAKYPKARDAVYLEGHPVRTGTHAAGVLVCNDAISKYAVVDSNGVAHIDKHDIEALNLLKIDVLGLRTLTVLSDLGVAVDWYSLPLNDKDTYAVFNRRALSGIFQFEGITMRSLSAVVHFDTINDIDAVTALARPGPFNTGVHNRWVDIKAGKEDKYTMPIMKKLLPNTYGLPLYQEDTMRLVREIGGFTWEQTAFVRKSISKHMGEAGIKTLTSTFIAGALERGLTQQEAEQIWEQIYSMGAWQMNKAHTYSYATISYWTAYAKAHYPLHFAASTLRHAKDEESAVQYLRELVSEGGKYTYFDAERSLADWAVVDGELLGGFKSLKGIGDAKAAKYIAARPLTATQEATLYALPSPFKDVLYLSHTYASYYEGKEAIRGRVLPIAEIPEHPKHGAEYVFLGELSDKNQRDENEEVRIKNRGGKRIPASEPTVFLDMRIKDDSGLIGARISRWQYGKMGREICESCPLGSVFLIRARFFNGIRFAFVTKIKRLA